MPHLTINGITVATLRGSFRELGEYRGQVSERGSDGRLFDSHSVRAREFEGDSVYLSPAVGEALRRLLDGDGHSWSFDDDTYSAKGLGPVAGGSYTRFGTGGKYGGRLEVSSGSLFEVDLSKRMGVRDTWDPTMGWTVIFWHNDSGYSHYIATGAVAVTRGASSGNPAGVTQYKAGIAGSHGIGNVIHVQSNGEVAIYGYDLAGVAGAHDYDDFVVLPFELPAEWASPLSAFMGSSAWPGNPKLSVDGDGVHGGPIVVRGKPGPVRQKTIEVDGTYYDNARHMPFSLMQV